MEFGYLSLSTVYTVNQLSDFLGEYQDKILQTIVEEVNETYFLPDIQREFIWDENKSEFEEKEYDAPEAALTKVFSSQPTQILSRDAHSFTFYH